MLFNKTDKQPIGCLNCFVPKPTTLAKKDTVDAWVCVVFKIISHDDKKILNYVKSCSNEDIPLSIVDIFKRRWPNSTILVSQNTSVHDYVEYEYNEQDNLFYLVDTSAKEYKQRLNNYKEQDKDWLDLDIFLHKGRLLTVYDLKEMEGAKIWDDKDNKIVQLIKVEEGVVDPTDFDNWEEYEKHKNDTYLNFIFDNCSLSDGAIECEKRFYEYIENSKISEN